jgi:hypothetical protein
MKNPVGLRRAGFFIGRRLFGADKARCVGIARGVSADML